MRVDLTHMMFADDLLLFSRADEPSIKAIFDAFIKFSTASRLEANLHKSKVYLAAVSDDVADHIVGELGIPKGTFPIKSLGVPLTTRKLNYTECKPLIEKIVTRIKSWSARMLSYAGRIQLIKEIQRLCRCFLWTSSDVSSRKAPISWETVYLNKSCGG